MLPIILTSNCSRIFDFHYFPVLLLCFPFFSPQIVPVSLTSIISLYYFYASHSSHLKLFLYLWLPLFPCITFMLPILLTSNCSCIFDFHYFPVLLLCFPFFSPQTVPVSLTSFPLPRFCTAGQIPSWIQNTVWLCRQSVTPPTRHHTQRCTVLLFESCLHDSLSSPWLHHTHQPFPRLLPSLACSQWQWMYQSFQHQRWKRGVMDIKIKEKILQYTTIYLYVSHKRGLCSSSSFYYTLHKLEFEQLCCKSLFYGSCASYSL